ncbi:MAG: sarcosine oxidase subunit gamma family protein [Pseudomonadota bacterium]
MAKPIYSSPLSHLSLSPRPSEQTAETSLADLGRVGFFHVLARKDKAAETAVQMGVSITPGQAAHLEGGGVAFPTAPGEWMIICAASTANEELSRWRVQLEGAAYISDQSHGRAALRLSGPYAARLLAKECTVDLHLSHLPTGSFAQTQLAGIGVLIHRISDTPSFDLYCYSGFADSFWHWLTDAGAEFGLQTYQKDQADG